MKQYVCWLTFSLLMLVAANSSATTLMKLTDDELVQRAEYVIAGHVDRIETRLERNDTPFQYITINVTKVLKQNDSSPLLQNDKVAIRQIGGKVGETTLVVDGLAQFVENEDVVVCLEQDTNTGLFYVVGNSQGMFHMVNNELINDTTDGTMFARKGANGEIVFAGGEVKKTTISSIKNKIEKAADNEEEAR